jgi:hypothetical protein
MAAGSRVLAAPDSSQDASASSPASILPPPGVLLGPVSGGSLALYVEGRAAALRLRAANNTASGDPQGSGSGAVAWRPAVVSLLSSGGASHTAFVPGGQGEGSLTGAAGQVLLRRLQEVEYEVKVSGADDAPRSLDASLSFRRRRQVPSYTFELPCRATQTIACCWRI